MITIIDHYSQAPGEKGNNRFIYLAKLLCAKGYQVEIVTSDFSHIKKQTRNIPQEEIDKLPFGYVMLHEPVYKKNVCLQRIASHYIFGKNLAKYLKDRTDIDCVYISVPSLDVGKAAADYCKRQGIPFFVDIQDVWPEAFELVLPMKQITRHLLAPMRRTANYVYETADYIVAVSDTYLKRGLLNKKDPEGMCVFLGTDLHDFDKAVRNSRIDKPKSEFWVGYAGTLGASYNLDIVIRACKKIVDDGYSRIRVKVLGDGPDLERLKNDAKGLPVEFLGRVDYAKMDGILAACDIAVNPIVAGAAQSIINKHGDYAAAGIPVVSTQESSEYKELIARYNCGISCSPNDIDAVAKAIEYFSENEEERVLYGANSRRMAEELFDRSKTYPLIVEQIEKRLSRD